MVKKRLVVKIFKKGDLRDCNNWREVTLLPVIRKIFCRMLLERVKIDVDKKLQKSRLDLHRRQVQQKRSLH